MSLAIHCNKLLRSGQIINQSELARCAQIMAVLQTQILTLLNLAPDIQENLPFLPRFMDGCGEVKVKDVRTIAMKLDREVQSELSRQKVCECIPHYH